MHEDFFPILSKTDKEKSRNCLKKNMMRLSGKILCKYKRFMTRLQIQAKSTNSNTILLLMYTGIKEHKNKIIGINCMSKCVLQIWRKHCILCYRVINLVIERNTISCIPITSRIVIKNAVIDDRWS